MKKEQVNNLHKINLMEAYLIETLRSTNNVSNQELLDFTNRKEIEGWQKLYPQLDFQGLVTLANQDLNLLNQ